MVDYNKFISKSPRKRRFQKAKQKMVVHTPTGTHNVEITDKHRANCWEKHFGNSNSGICKFCDWSFPIKVPDNITKLLQIKDDDNNDKAYHNAYPPAEFQLFHEVILDSTENCNTLTIDSIIGTTLIPVCFYCSDIIKSNCQNTVISMAIDDDNIDMYKKYIIDYLRNTNKCCYENNDNKKYGSHCLNQTNPSKSDMYCDYHMSLQNNILGGNILGGNILGGNILGGMYNKYPNLKCKMLSNICSQFT